MVLRGKDLTGSVYNMVTVVERRGNDKWGNAIYQCECECGKQFERLSQHIRDPKVISCGCQRSTGGRRGKDSPNWKGVGDLSSSFLCGIKSHATRRNIPFVLTIGYLWDLFTKQGKKCALSGIPLTIKQQGHQYFIEGNASVDRVDSSKGYEEGNVQWVHKDVNFMKQAFDQDYFLSLCRSIVKNNKKK